MPKKNTIPLTIITLLLLSFPCHAEVQVTQNKLTMNVDGATFHEVLHTLTEQAQIDIVTLEETNIGNVTISKRFWGLPLEEGIQRMLSGWNYGITRDVSTGKIKTLYLVSRRNDSSTLGSLPAALASSPSNQDVSQSESQPTVLSQTYGTKALEPINREESEGEEDFFNDDELETLPPNLIETLERWQRNGNG